MQTHIWPSLRLITLVSLSCATSTAVAQTATALHVRAEREDARYRQGDTVSFVITQTGDTPLPEGTALEWELSKDGTAPILRGSTTVQDSTALVHGTLDESGFLRLKVFYNDPARPPNSGRRVAVGGAAIAPEQISPSMPVPDDFDDFWNAQKAELASIPLNIRLEYQTELSTDTLDVFDAKADCVDATPVSGYLARPKGSARGSLPAIITLHGAGVSPALPNNAIYWAKRNMLALDINAHGLPNDMPAAYYSDLYKGGRLDGYRYMGRTSREATYFRGMFLRALRAIDLLAAQPEWDGRTLILYGVSQGGAQAIAAGSLDPRVTFVAAAEPAMCDHTGMLANRATGWPRWGLIEEGRHDPAMLEASRYYDMVNFATRAHKDGCFVAGFIDENCQPTGIYAMYNAWVGGKQMFDDIEAAHINTPEATRFMISSVMKHIARD